MTFVDPYFDENIGELRNLLGAASAEEFHELEAQIVFANELELEATNIPRTNDFEEVLSIHKQLFKGVYDWAGKVRTVDIKKNDGDAEFSPETLKYLSKKYKIIVATNGPQTATKQKLEKIGCLQYVTEVLSADMFGYMKPKVEFFHAIEDRYSDNKIEDYLIIGDSLKSDVGFGMNTGIDSCWFNQKHEDIDAVHTPTFIINTLRELSGIL